MKHPERRYSVGFLESSLGKWRRAQMRSMDSRYEVQNLNLELS